MQLDCGRRRLDIQLGAQRLDAGLVLAQREVVLALPAIAAHQPAVRILTAVIVAERALAQRRAGSVLALAKVKLPKAFECVQVSHPQPLAGHHRPLIVRIIGHEIALVKAGRHFVLGRCGGELAVCLEAPAGSHAPFELVAIQPEL